MLDAVVAAAFENVEEADEIGIGVGVRMVEGVAHAGLRGEMHDAVRPFRREEVGDGGTVGEVGLHETEVGEGCEPLEARLLQ